MKLITILNLLVKGYLIRIVSGYSTLLEDVPLSVKSVMQKSVSLSATEEETVLAVSCAHDMLYDRRVLMSLGLKVKYL